MHVVLLQLKITGQDWATKPGGGSGWRVSSAGVTTSGGTIRQAKGGRSMQWSVKRILKKGATNDS